MVKRILLILTAVIVIVLLGAFVFTVIYQAGTAEKFPPFSLVDVDGTQMHYHEAGEGADVLIIHGGSGTLHDFLLSPLYDVLIENYHVVIIDRPGLGYSETGPHAGAGPQADLVYGLALELGLERPVLIGQSWGAGVAMIYAVQYPDELSGILMLGGHPYVWEEEVKEDFIYSLVEIPVLGDFLLNTIYTPLGAIVIGPSRFEQSTILAPLTEWPSAHAEAVLRMQLRPSHVRAQAWEFFHYEESLKTWQGRFNEVSVPIVYMVGGLDEGSLEQYEYMQLEHASTPLVLLPDADHFLWFAYPDEVANALDDLVGMIE